MRRELIQEYVDKGGEKLSEFGVHYCYEQFRDLQDHPPLEAVLCEALREALKEIGHPLKNGDGEAYADWFRNWHHALDPKAELPFELPKNAFPQLDPRLTGGSDQAQGEALDRIFQNALEAIDGHARAVQTGSISSRAIPPGLLKLVAARLPEILDAKFRELLVLPENDVAWKTALDGSVGTLLVRTNQILRFQEEQVRRRRGARADCGRRSGQVTRRETGMGRKLVKLLEDVSGRSEEPGEASFERLLERSRDLGRLAVRTQKREQIEKRMGEVEKLARD